MVKVFGRICCNSYNWNVNCLFQIKGGMIISFLPSSSEQCLWAYHTAELCPFASYKYYINIVEFKWIKIIVFIIIIIQQDILWCYLQTKNEVGALIIDNHFMDQWKSFFLWMNIFLIHRFLRILMNTLEVSSYILCGIYWEVYRKLSQTSVKKCKCSD